MSFKNEISEIRNQLAGACGGHSQYGVVEIVSAIKGQLNQGCFFGKDDEIDEILEEAASQEHEQWPDLAKYETLLEAFKQEYEARKNKEKPADKVPAMKDKTLEELQQLIVDATAELYVRAKGCVRLDHNEAPPTGGAFLHNQPATGNNSCYWYPSLEAANAALYNIGPSHKVRPSKKTEGCFFMDYTYPGCCESVAYTSLTMD